MKNTNRHRSLFLILILAGLGLIALVATIEQTQKGKLASVLSAPREMAKLATCKSSSQSQAPHLTDLVECEMLTASGQRGFVELQRDRVAEFQAAGIEVALNSKAEMIVTDSRILSRENWMNWYLYSLGGVCIFLGAVFFMRTRGQKNPG